MGWLLDLEPSNFLPTFKHFCDSICLMDCLTENLATETVLHVVLCPTKCMFLLHWKK